MVTDKMLYWTAVCVITVGVGNSFVHHHQDFARDLGRRAMVIATAVSSRGQRQFDHGHVFVARSQADFDRSQAMVDRIQAQVACIQSRIAQRQAALDRAQALRTRLAVAQNMREIVVSVPEISSKSVVVDAWDDDSEQ